MALEAVGSNPITHPMKNALLSTNKGAFLNIYALSNNSGFTNNNVNPKDALPQKRYQMNTYLKSFDFPGEERENDHFLHFHMTCYDNFYPFRTLHKDFTHIEFEPITILYGGNGSGKSTVLNVIAEKLGITRSVKINTTDFFEDYVYLCDCKTSKEMPIAKIITSDDVFKNLFLTREKNELIDRKRREIFELHDRYNKPDAFQKTLSGKSLIKNADLLQDFFDARATRSKYARSRVEQNIIGKSNGETALDFFVNEIKDEGVYLLDEPENSLSAAFQLELTAFLSDSARFFGAQLVIATHSPFLLSIPNAKIYNLDTSPVSETYDFTTLENMRIYHDFFKKISDRFEK